MNYSKDYYLFFLSKINNFVWKPFNEMFFCSFVFYRTNVWISFYKVYPCLDLQKEVMS